MIEPKQLLEYVIRPVLKDLDLWSKAAELLVLGTACQESGCGRYLRQLGGGPALGIYQMEPLTFTDIHANFLMHRPALASRVENWQLSNMRPGATAQNELMGNLYYATAMCRLHYLRVPAPIPDYVAGQAQFWKTHYNTELGAGTIQDYLNNWNRHVGPELLV